MTSNNLKKMHEDNEIAFFVVSTNRLNEFSKLVAQVISPNLESDSVLLQAANKLKTALQNEQYEFRNSETLDFLAVMDLFEDKVVTAKSIKASHKDVNDFLERVIKLKAKVTRLDVDSLLVEAKI